MTAHASAPPRRQSRLASGLHRLGVYGWVSVGFAVFVVLLAVFGPALAPHDPLAGSDATLAATSSSHWLGTDYLGRDVLSRLLHGSRISVLAALEAAGVAFTVGVPAAVLSVYAQRWFEWLSLRVIDTLIAVPFLTFAVAVTQLIGNGLHQAMIVVGVMTAPLFYRVTRAATLQVGQAHYVESARLYGGSTWYVVTRHILPKVIPAILIAAATSVATGLIIVSSLTFLGIGITPPEPSWGGLISADLGYLGQKPWAPLYPAFLITATVVALNGIADLARRPADHKQIASGLYLLQAKPSSRTGEGARR
ncbi:ABC transporter permease [Mycobacterium sp. C31M]